MASSRPGNGSSKNLALSPTNSALPPGTFVSRAIALTGQAGSQAPQSMHSAGLM